MNKNVELTARMNDHSGKKSACRQEMRNNEFSSSVLSGA